MCLTEIILNLSACQLISYTFHWTKINSLSWPLPKKSTFRSLFFKQFRVSLSQKFMIGLYMKYFKFYYLGSGKKNRSWWFWLFLPSCKNCSCHLMKYTFTQMFWLSMAICNGNLWISRTFWIVFMIFMIHPALG